MAEMSQFQKAIYDLERMHLHMKQGYEEDLRRLRHELESRGIPVPVPVAPVISRKMSLLTPGIVTDGKW